MIFQAVLCYCVTSFIDLAPSRLTYVQNVAKAKGAAEQVEAEVKRLEEAVMAAGGVKLRAQKSKVEGIREQISTLQVLHLPFVAALPLIVLLYLLSFSCLTFTGAQHQSCGRAQDLFTQPNQAAGEDRHSQGRARENCGADPRTDRIIQGHRERRHQGDIIDYYLQLTF